MKRFLFMLSCLLLGTAFVMAQVQVSGTVTDNSGTPLPGVNVVVKGTTTGSVTNTDGNYQITAPGMNSILEFSYVGYLTQDIEVGSQTSISVVLEEDVLGLEEVVVVGYGTQRKMDVTGAVATLKGDEITSIPTPNFEEGMQGKIPGMEMKKTSAEPGGGISVKIRGTNSLLGNNEPLYVIDGFPMTNDNTSRPGGWESQKPLNLLSNLNPNDIASVQVLKDASATAIYGSRGANGVIIITTKKGQQGKSVIDFEYSHSISQAKAPFELCNVEDYARIENEAIINTEGVDFRYTADNTYGLENATPEELGATYGDGTDWLDEVMQTGHVNNYNLSIQGGDARTTYLISGNYYDETGVLLNSNFQKGTIRSNISSQVNKRLKVDINMSASRYFADRSQQTGRLTGGGPDRLGLIVEAFRANPMTTPETPHLEPNDLLQHEPGRDNVTNFIYNPVQQANKVDNSEAMNFFLGSINAELMIVEGLNLNFRGGYNFQSQERISFLPMSTPVVNSYGGLGNHNFYDRRNFLYENYLNYNKTFADRHNLDATLGYSLEQDRIQSKSQGGSSFNFDIQGIYGWGQLQTPSPMSISESQRQLASVYGRLFYSFANKYMVTFTARQDGSSVFAENNKWAFFPSGALAWVISEESFMESASWVSNLKLRASYGIVGNQAIAPYGSLAKIRSSAGYAAGIVLNNKKQSGLLPWTPANPDLIWESTKQLDVGLDASFLSNRVQFAIDVYQKNTVDLLQSKPVPSFTGYETFTTNFGEISNKGVEILLGGAILSERDLTWNSTLTWSYNRNEIVDLGLNSDGTPLIQALPPSTGISHSETLTMFILGEPIGSFWGLEWLGNLSQADVDAGVPFSGNLDSPGDQKFKDQPTVDTDGDGIPDEGDGVITDADNVVIGNAQPDFIFGFDNTLTWKNFTLNFFFNGVVGGKVANMIKQYTELGAIRNGGGHHSKDYAENYWTESNTDTRYPRPGGGGGFSSYYLEDATFVRLQSASITYSLPVQKFGWQGIRNASVYVRGSNLLLFTNYSGFDPEGQFTGQSEANQNIDLGNYPRPTTVEIGVKLGF